MQIVKKILIFTLLCLTFILPTNLVFGSDNGTADFTYTVDANGDLIPTQHAYLSSGVIEQFEINNSEIKTISNPEDIYYLTELDKYYIADTGNKRVLVCDSSLKTAISVGEGILDTPQGVCATSDGDIYVADYGLKKVVVFSGDEYKTYGKPDHPLYGENVTFKPSKITVDSNKTMFIIDAGNANGIVQINKEGNFSGYFGANYITPDLSYIIKFLFSSKEQKSKLYRSPIAPTNICFDPEGLLVTVTSGIKGNALKRLNIAGNNMFSDDMFFSVDYLDVCISHEGIIITIDKSGYINEFDKEGNLLFTFGGKDTTGKMNGQFIDPKSIEVNDDYSLFILDKNKIQVFAQTEFATLVHQALNLYNEGLYEESHAPWDKVLKMNSMFDLAHSGLGKAYLREMEYNKALTEFKIAKDVNGYSEAYWEVRNEWLTNYAQVLVFIAIILVLAVIIVKRTKLWEMQKEGITALNTKILKVKPINEFFYLFKFIKKPLNGFYEIKFHQKMSPLIASIWYLILFIIIILMNTSVGFIFNTDDIEQISLLRIFSTSLIPIFLFVICNYLISSITEGSGRFKDVYVGTICSFAPVICFMPFVIILSNFLTLNESFLYTLLTIVLWGWSFILLYFMIKDVQELQVGENNKNIILTVLTMLLFVALAFLVYILGSQLYNFIKDIVLEVISNG